ncbi:hypothetical protein [Cellulosimicrobium sp. 22601]|uniref:hypothetical protein n=1 Tax=unclassified Cellulosimicrobium TaxID=2624466 RepID=UPI003F826496
MQNEFLWLLWIFAASIVAGAVIVLVAYASGIAAAVFAEARASHRARRRRVWARRQVRRGERAVARELRAARSPGTRWVAPSRGGYAASPPVPSRVGRRADRLLALPIPPATPATVLRFERHRDGLMAVADATHEERT